MQVLSAPGHELLAGDVRARAGARGRLHATPQSHRSSAWTWRPPRLRRALAGRPDSVAREEDRRGSAYGRGVMTGGAWCLCSFLGLYQLGR